MTVVEADVLQAPLPATSFRAFGNIPFGLTTQILRLLLDDPASSLVSADLIVQFEAARKRASPWPSNLVSLGWLPWWEFRLARRLPAAVFEPAPSVDAGVLSIERRPRPLLEPARRQDYVTLVRTAFKRPGIPVTHSLRGRVPTRTWKRIARERGLRPNATSLELDVFDWAALFRAAHPNHG